ncbi:hypothetical protein Nepgr_003285 [Nepenthes gracilis]|uniref:Uncharacterized protein n=1 Tax=Nepenthes gracilis TaxID=150966 RepID=A0AAD3RZ73_NEPGR|nr:hypothetical protein Nepgr_003285 [Nepenthes gracilis]
MIAWENLNLPSPKTIISAAASVATTAFLCRTVSADLPPDELHAYFSSCLRNLSDRLSSQSTVVIEEFSNPLTPNQVLDAASLYLATKISPSTRRIKANTAHRKRTLVCDRQELGDRRPIQWRQIQMDPAQYHRDSVLHQYLPNVLNKAEEIQRGKREIKLYTVDYNGTDYWSCVSLDHLWSSDKVEMDPDAKKALVDDLDRFCRRKEYYKRVGKAWKRGEPLEYGAKVEEGNEKDHPLFQDVGQLLTQVQVTPAEVAVEPMKMDDAEIALLGFLEFLQSKRRDLHGASLCYCMEVKSSVI